MVLRHLEAVLNRDVVGTAGVLGRELPASGPELDPGQSPRCACGARLVSLVPIRVFALEERPSLVPSRRRCKRVHDCLRRFPNHVLSADGVREVPRPGGELLRRVVLAGEPAEYRLDGACLRAEYAVVDLVGKLERCAGVPHALVRETSRPGQATENRRLHRRPRPRFLQRLAEEDD